MSRSETALILGGILAWLGTAPPVIFGKAPGERNVALSLRELQERLQKSELDPESSLPFQELDGVFLDHRDIVLLGRGPGRFPVSADDVVLALRAMWLTDEPPGVSIDPRPDPDLPYGIEPWQDVVYFGGIEGTRAGLYAFSSDYWMKRLATGDVSVPLPGFKRYIDLALEDGALRDLPANRSWFYPKATEIVVSEARDLMLFESHGIEVLTETEHSLFDRERTFDLFLGQDEYAEKFARSFTERYDELAIFHPDLARLKSFFALCEVFRWSEVVGLPTGRIRRDDWLYLLYDYLPVPAYSTPRVRTIVATTQRGGVGATMVGGVSGEIRLPDRPKIDTSGRLRRLADQLRQQRPASSLVWDYVPSTSAGDPGEAIRNALRRQESLTELRRSLSGEEGILGLEPLADGRIAAWVERQGRYELLHVSREQIEVAATGEPAEEALDAAARDVCRRSSDADVAFVHLRRRGETAVLQVGRGEPIEMPMSRLLAAARGEEPHRSAVGRLFSDVGESFVFYRDGRSLARRAPPSSELDEPSLWASALERICGRCSVYVSSDPERARHNRRQLVARGRRRDWTVLAPGSESGLATPTDETGETPNWILLSELRGKELVDYLTSLGERNLLAGRLIVVLSPLEPAEVEDLLSRYGAVGIRQPLEAVLPQAAERAIEKMDEVLRESEASSYPGEQILQQAVDKALEDGGPWNQELAKMRRSFVQI